MSIRVGIVGISGFGGGEAMRLVASHPSFELIYAAGEGSAGSRLVDRFPGVPAKLAELVIEKWDPVTLPKLDVLFASLPTGASAEALARVPKDVKIVDIGGDHRYVEGWAYGLADVWPAQIEGQIRVANPGCFPAATLNALAPLLANKLIEPGNIVIVGARDLDAQERKIVKKSGIHVFTMRDIDERGMRDVMSEALKYAMDDTAGVAVSLDMDFVDPADAPGVGTPVRGGVTYREAHLAMEMIADSEAMVSLEVVEINPILDEHNRTALLGVELVLSALGQKIL